MVESMDDSCHQADMCHGHQFVNAMPTDVQVECQNCTEADLAL